jgi:endonuclease/exonuclease/phosphatase family metal-dependent hydrolase
LNGPRFTVATWNTEWRRPSSADAWLIKERLFHHSPDVICLTEAYPDLLEGAGKMISSAADYGYRLIEGRRKVVLWSREPWEDIDRTGHPDLPPGRFVAGRTRTPLGDVQVIGLCIPWRDAHHRSGRKDRQPWEDHLGFLAALERISCRWEGPTIILGDFNQHIPIGRAPAHVHEALRRALLSRFQIATAGPLAPLDRRSVDHVLHSSEFASEEVAALSNLDAKGREISDHFGVIARVRVTSAER